MIKLHACFLRSLQIFLLTQFSLGAQTRFLLDYTCIGINASSSLGIIRELEFFTSLGLLKGDPNYVSGITITDFLDGKAIEPVAFDQSSSESASIVVLNRGMSKTEIAVKHYISLRLGGVSQVLALNLVKNTGQVSWGEFKIDFNYFSKLEQNKKDQIQFMFDFKSPFLSQGQLFYVTDGDVVRLALLNEMLNEVIWEGVLDSRNFHDPVSNRFVENILMKDPSSLNEKDMEQRKFLVIDKLLREKINVDWINPIQITCLKNIHPTYSEKDQEE